MDTESDDEQFSKAKAIRDKELRSVRAEEQLVLSQSAGVKKGSKKASKVKEADLRKKVLKKSLKEGLKKASGTVTKPKVFVTDYNYSLFTLFSFNSNLLISRSSNLSSRNPLRRWSLNAKTRQKGSKLRVSRLKEQRRPLPRKK